MPSNGTKPFPTRTRLLRRRSMRTLASIELLPKLQTLRLVSVVLGLGNLGLVVLGGYLLSSALFGCPGGVKLPFAVVALVAGIRIICMVGSGFAQVATAATIVSCATEGSAAAADALIRHERRMRYKRWLWWTRFGMGVTILQFVGALYLLYVIVKTFTFDGNSKECFSGWDTGSRGIQRMSVVVFLILAWLTVIIQCFTGSDVLRWRSFYSTHDTAWKAHYLEVFDHGIREALCCLGRVKYLSVLEEDEVYSVARLLGDLVAYRASGTGHLEFLAGLALLQRHQQSQVSCNELVEAPESRLREAFTYHQFAEAAYTGPLLDFGRNPVLFPCAWLYRQGVLTPWSRNRRPVLDGDNWWRGHAAAFLKYVNLPPDVLRRGRVSQTKREAAFFVVVLHHLKSVVIAVRGTETPEDLLTDGLCRECNLTEDDLDGLINAEHLAPEVRQKVLSSFPHYGHSGIVESARELFMQVEGMPEYKENYHSNTTGFLSSLMGVGQECHGYRVCIVGHSLGGSVATLLGIKLYRRFPDLHVYSYGTLPCVDFIVAEACSGFVTSIVYNDEFSARLSVNSIIRLRAAAITALSEDSSADSAMICKIARRILLGNNLHESERNNDGTGPPLETGTMKLESNNNVYRRNFKYAINGSSEPIQVVHGLEETSLTDNVNTNFRRRGFDELNSRNILEDDIYESNVNNMECFEGSDDLISFGQHASQFMGNATPSVNISIEDPPEMFLPGLIIHIVPEQRSIFPLWNAWKLLDRKQSYKTFVTSRESFKDIVVTPYMFLDHLPWRCHHAMQKVLETRKSEGQFAEDFSSSGVCAV